MLETHGLMDRVLSCMMDNVSSNDMQLTTLTTLSNSIEPEHRIRCFNHMLQLFACALLKSFDSPATRISDHETESNDGTLYLMDDNGVGEGKDDEDDEDDEEGNSDDSEDDDDDTGSVAPDSMSDELVKNTQQVRAVLTKVIS
jgi:hypothetical protein